MTETKYYIVSPEHMNSRDLLTFWAERACGYTVNMDKAMLLSEEELKEYPANKYPRWHEGISNWRATEDFIISTTDLEQLAKPMKVAYRI